MKTYARIEQGVVVEILTSAVDPHTIFYPSLQWQEVTSPGVLPGWLLTATGFTAPPTPTASMPVTPTLAQLQSELAALAAQIAAFTPKTGG